MFLVTFFDELFRLPIDGNFCSNAALIATFLKMSVVCGSDGLLCHGFSRDFVSPLINFPLPFSVYGEEPFIQVSDFFL